jgi:hypothetical protein
VVLGVRALQGAIMVLGHHRMHAPEAPHPRISRPACNSG